MKKIFNIMLLAVVALSAVCFSSCKEDEPTVNLSPTQIYRAVILSAEGGNIAPSMVKYMKSKPTIISHLSEEETYFYWQQAIDAFVAKYADGFKVAEEIEDSKGNVIDKIPFEGVLNVEMGLENEEGEILEVASIELTPTSSKLISVDKTISYKAVVASAEGSNLSAELRQEILDRVKYCSALNQTGVYAIWDEYLDTLAKEYEKGIKYAGKYQDENLIWQNIPFEGDLVVKLELKNAQGAVEKVATLTISSSSCSLQK